MTSESKNALLDQFPLFNVLTNEEKDMLETMQESSNFEPKPEKNEKSFFDKVREMFSWFLIILFFIGDARV